MNKHYLVFDHLPPNLVRPMSPFSDPPPTSTPSETWTLNSSSLIDRTLPLHLFV